MSRRCWLGVNCCIIGFLPQLICLGSPPSGLPGAVAGQSCQPIGFRARLSSCLLSCFGGTVGYALGEAHRPVCFCDGLSRTGLGALGLVLLGAHPAACLSFRLFGGLERVGDFCTSFGLDELVGVLAGPLDPSLHPAIGVTFSLLHSAI